MSTSRRSKLFAALILAVALAALPATAGATITYGRGFVKQHVYYAQDNGSGAHQIGLGRNSRISPDGELVVYEKSNGNTAEMRLYSIAAGKGQRLLNPWRESYVFAWSPDSTTIAALRGGLNGPATLLLINLQTGRRTKVATGYVNGVSFSPESDEIVFGISQSQNFPPRSDIFRYSVATGLTTSLTRNKTSAYPLWGPAGKIVFARLLGGKRRQYGSKNELFLMDEEGKGAVQLTHTAVDPLTQGLFPTAWSESGGQLLTEYGGQDTSYAVAVNPLTGAERSLSPGNEETGFVGTAISRDGTTVLGFDGGFEGPGAPHPKVVTVPFGGGPQKVLVTNAFEPSWSD